MMKKFLYFLIFSLLFHLGCNIKGQDVYIDKSDSLRRVKKEIMVLPFAFYLQTLGVAGAVDIGTRGIIQDQLNTTLVGLITTNGSGYLYCDMVNLQTPIHRLFFSPNLNLAHYGALDVYNGLNANFPTDVAGSNFSDKNNFYRIKSNKLETELIFRYLLPLGYGRKNIINKVLMDEGIPEEGKIFSGNWIPFVSGRTFIESGLFYQDQTMNFPQPIGERKLRSAGYTIGFANENVDFLANPSVGSMLKFKLWKGTKEMSSTVPWKMYEGNFSVYFPIKSSTFRQQVIALNLWSRYVDSWNTLDGTAYERPSPFVGANLGGRFRLRGFPEARFSDRACWLYSGEYRVIPKWNPLSNWRLLKFVGIKVDWIQFVLFGEAGRVAPEWNLKTFHDHLKTDIGFGLRAMANQMIARMDVAYSKEGFQVQMYLGHAF